MELIDSSLENLGKIILEFKTFCDGEGKVSEADTRVKLIDRILTDVCHWPESNLKRENHTESGFSDYILKVHGRPLITVEAKREGISFLLPAGNRMRALKLNSSLLTSIEVKKAILQVRGYCDDLGVRYAVATNGYAWIIFRAIKEDGSWREGTARVFPTLESIQNEFTYFWNVLSFEAISNGGLDKEFGITIRPSRELHKVLTRITNPDAPLLRNSLSEQLNPVITNFFEDIADPSHLDKLQNCYVYSKTLKIASAEINVVIKDSIPKFLKDQGTKEIVQSEFDTGIFGETIEKVSQGQAGSCIYYLGALGRGKRLSKKGFN